MLKNNYKYTKTWSIIREIENHKNFTRKSNLPAIVSVENEICEIFTNVGRNISNNLSCSKFSSFKTHNKLYLQSFVFQEISTEDVSNVIDSIKSYSGPGKDDVLPKFVKLAKCILSQ